MDDTRPQNLSRRRFVVITLASLTGTLAIAGCGTRRRTRRRMRRRDRREDRREDRRDWLFDDD